MVSGIGRLAIRVVHGHRTDPAKKRLSGFTLLELLVAMVIGGFVVGAVFLTHHTQRKTYAAQEQIAAMQQNLRVALFHLERDLRMAGYNPTGRAMGAGFQSISSNSISIAMDIVGNSRHSRPDGHTDDPNERICYALDDNDKDGDLDLEKNDWLAVENVEALSFAYAFDNDGDGRLDWRDKDGNGRFDPGEIMWAIDADGNDMLDRDLDTNGDGTIDAEDDAADGREDGLIQGSQLPGGVEVGLDRIRAVRIWLLVRTGRPVEGYTDTSALSGSGAGYVVGNRVIRPSTEPGARFNAHHMRRLATSMVICRNLGK
ncbi:MAG: prepilin-type N-terminal cleavage/methylation domain-containing protein [Deltaproteobacteria bacterium]|nr:prepilin-type N-terminal cleavage/methylation domain-containing protein [Deltaproteobacteria bacterium]